MQSLVLSDPLFGTLWQKTAWTSTANTGNSSCLSASYPPQPAHVPPPPFPELSESIKANIHTEVYDVDYLWEAILIRVEIGRK